MASKSKTKEIRTDWPFTSGIDADQKHAGRQINLIPSEGSLTPKRLKTGMMD